jgi:hypothetical protein
MSIPIKINDNYSIAKDSILAKYKNIDVFFRDCINALYGEGNTNIEVNCFLSSNIVVKNSKYKLSILNSLKTKTGVYIFLDNESIPVYIGIGGQKVNAKQDLKVRISQELRAYCQNNVTTNYSKDSGATLSKNIQNIDTLLTNNQVSPDDSVETIKSFSLITIAVGAITDENSVNNSQALETILIALFHPKYNK